MRKATAALQPPPAPPVAQADAVEVSIGLFPAFIAKATSKYNAYLARSDVSKDAKAQIREFDVSQFETLIGMLSNIEFATSSDIGWANGIVSTDMPPRNGRIPPSCTHPAVSRKNNHRY